MFLLILKHFIYLIQRERVCAQAGGGAEGEKEADSSLSREPECSRAQSQDLGIMTSQRQTPN